MPSASSKSSQPPLQVNVDLLQEPMKGAVSVLEKKLRNLEKRKIKLVETQKKAAQGNELNDDQKKALQNLTLVENSLDTVKELHKLMCSLELEYVKLTKKEQKRVKQEQRDSLDGKSQQLSYQIVEFQGILGDLTDEVRPDFLAGSNGACQLTEDELSQLDGIYELINPASGENSTTKLSARVTKAGEHLINLVEGKDLPVLDVTYKQINDTLKRIKDSGYFDKEQTNGDQDAEELPPTDNVNEQHLVEAMSGECESPEEESPEEEYPPRQFQEAEIPVHSTHMNEPVNGVDLPPEVQQVQQTTDEQIDFLGESEISAPVTEGSLNPVSPEFVPRNLQSSSDEGTTAFEIPPEQAATTNVGWGEPESASSNDGWQSVPENHSAGQHGSGHRGKGGSGRGRFGGGGRGRGRGAGGYHRGGGRQEGGYHQGGNRGGRGGGGNYRGDGGNYRGGNRGNRGSSGQRGGQRGGPRGGGSREGGFNRQSQQ